MEKHKKAHSPQNYIFIESSLDSNAKLISPEIPAGTEMCLKFYHFFRGTDIDSIDVYINSKLIWRQVPNEKMEPTGWNLAQVSLYFKENSILWIQLKSSGMFGDIGIDSISVSLCECNTGNECSLFF